MVNQMDRRAQIWVVPTKMNHKWSCILKIESWLFGHLDNGWSDGPSDGIWWHRGRSTLVQIMTNCLMAPSHYLNQCWLITKGVQLHSPEVNFIELCRSSILANNYRSASQCPGLIKSSCPTTDNLLIQKANFHSATPMGPYCHRWIPSIRILSFSEYLRVYAQCI